MSKALEGTIQIVTARLSNTASYVDGDEGRMVAAFIHEVYKELSEIEQQEIKANPRHPVAVPLVN